MQWQQSLQGIGIYPFAMLKIRRTLNGDVVLYLSGRMDAENIVELETRLSQEASDSRTVLDLKDLTLVDQEVVRFLRGCEADGIQLRNCPAYIRGSGSTKKSPEVGTRIVGGHNECSPSAQSSRSTLLAAWL
jgi:hypothetical protein